MQLLDAYGNWAPNINQDDWTPGNSTSGGGALSGTGAPDNSLGDNGNIYINLTNGDVYSKSGDVWILQADGSGGIEQVIDGASNDPVGDNVIPDDPTKPAIYYQNGGTFSLWSWNVTGQAWTPLLGP